MKILLPLVATTVFFTLPLMADEAKKVYSLLDLREMVYNHQKCDPIFRDLHELNKEPIVLQFAKNTQGKITATHQGNKIKNYSHKVVAQKSKEGSLQRMVLGSFELNHEVIEYFVAITGNTVNEKHQHLYPTILTAADGHCHFAALVKPDEQTVASFKKQIKSGAAAQGKDLNKK
jgi:hypothetical protein